MNYWFLYITGVIKIYFIRQCISSRIIWSWNAFWLIIIPNCSVWSVLYAHLGFASGRFHSASGLRVVLRAPFSIAQHCKVCVCECVWAVGNRDLVCSRQWREWRLASPSSWKNPWVLLFGHRCVPAICFPVRPLRGIRSSHGSILTHVCVHVRAKRAGSGVNIQDFYK